MVINYILDACALIAFLYDETGADIIHTILENALNNKNIVYMNKLNFYEVYYNVKRVEDDEKADILYNMVLKLPINIISDFSDDAFFKAASLKVKYDISLADSIILGEAIIRNAVVITADHHEMDIIEANEDIKFEWIR